jgi:hypothetical protein
MYKNVYDTLSKETWLLLTTLVVMAVFGINPDHAEADGCKLTDFADHVELVCIGKAANNQTGAPKSLQPQSAATSDTSGSDTLINGAQASRKRRQIETVRSLNTHRFDTVETQKAESESSKEQR